MAVDKSIEIRKKLWINNDILEKQSHRSIHNPPVAALKSSHPYETPAYQVT